MNPLEEVIKAAKETAAKNDAVFICAKFVNNVIVENVRVNIPEIFDEDFKKQDPGKIVSLGNPKEVVEIPTYYRYGIVVGKYYENNKKIFVTQNIFNPYNFGGAVVADIEVVSKIDLHLGVERIILNIKVKDVSLSEASTRLLIGVDEGCVKIPNTIKRIDFQKIYRPVLARKNEKIKALRKVA